MDFERVRARLRELGVHWIRDGACGTCLAHVDHLRALAADGIRSQLILGSPRDGEAWLDTQVRVLRGRLATAAGAVEGPNEYDVAGDPAWVANLRRWQQAIWSRVKGDPVLCRLLVVGPTIVWRANRALAGDLSPWLDAGNMHPYPGGNAPTLAHLFDEVALARTNSAGKPVVASETGYHQALAGPSGDGHPPTSERAAALYFPRLFLAYFQRGVRRTFAYELVDSGADPSRTQRELHFGLLRADFSPKPAFTALRNLLALVRGGAGGGGSLRVRVDGRPDVRHLLLRGVDGAYSLALWRDVTVWDRVARHDVAVAPTPVKVTLGQAMRRAQVFVPSEGVGAVATVNAPREVALRLGAAVTVVRLTP
jgi:hypothetical protein